ncbi:response regulator [Vibrio sp. S4M6]|uniref:response regulator n=1 Tax=Vibrio sinus TaxID=2946865 RepID=UPI00202A303F|nr:response regulator [Vibrio sinus]MCL9780865.1 response regulator [Vibrio sinus]
MSSLPFNLSKSRVIIADSSPLVVANLKLLLREMGFSDRLVYVAKRVSHVISVMRQFSVDLLICDADFGGEGSGCALVHELRLRNILVDSSILFMLSTESHNESQYLISDMGADGYVSKPYSLFGLKGSLRETCFKKLSLKALYQLDNTLSKASAMDVFSEQYESLPELAEEIDKRKGQYFLSLRDYRSALVHYKKTSIQYTSIWPRVGLATCLIRLNDYNRAQQYLREALSELGSSNTQLLDMLAHIHLLLGETRRAERCLYKASELASGNRLRFKCKSIVNEALGDSVTALADYQAYAKKSLNKQRSTLVDTINILRLKLQVLTNDDNQQLTNIQKLVMALNKGNEGLPVLLLTTHIALIKREYAGLRSGLSLLLKGYVELDLDYYWYLSSILFQVHDDYCLEQVLEHYESHFRLDKNMLLGSCEHVRIESLKSAQSKRKSESTRALSEIRQLKSESAGQTLLKAMARCDSHPFCIDSARLLLELASDGIPRTVAAEPMQNTLMGIEQLIQHSLLLKDIEKETLVARLKNVTHQLNEMIGVPE